MHRRKRRVGDFPIENEQDAGGRLKQPEDSGAEAQPSENGQNLAAQRRAPLLDLRAHPTALACPGGPKNIHFVAGRGDQPSGAGKTDRKRVVEEKSESVRVDLGGRRNIKRTKTEEASRQQKLTKTPIE